MTWRRAGKADLDWITALLRGHIQTSMFLLDNLQKYGLGSDAPYGMQIWCLGAADGIFAITNSGSVMMQAPTATALDWQAAGQLIAGREIGFILGDAPQSRAFMAVNGLEGLPATRDSDEPGFHLDLNDLVLDQRDGEHLRRFADVPMDLLVEWGAAYNVEVTGLDRAAAQKITRMHTSMYLKRDSHRMLYAGDQPVSRTGFNAQVDDVVQIGGVFTPQALRGQGYARRAVAHHLAEARAQGVRQAILFAASEQAARAYRGIGFKPAGVFTLVVFHPTAQIEKVSA